jgi:hypothetical protein
MKTKTMIAGVLLATVYAASAGITSVSNLGVGSVTDKDLSAEGTTDWIMLGQGGGASGITSRDEKAGVDFISAVTVTGTHDSWNAHPSSFTWDGLGGSVSGDWEAKPQDGVALTDQSLEFSVNSLAAGDYTMMLYTSSYDAAQLLTASIGASSMTAEQARGRDITSYSVDFTIEAGDVLNIDFSRNDTTAATYSNVGISAVTIAAIPEPATMGLIGCFGGGLLFIRRRFMM